MAAAWQASGALAATQTSNTQTPGNPAHQTDDVLICIGTVQHLTATCATPSGWTLQHGPIRSALLSTYIFWKTATSGAEANPSLVWTGCATSDAKFGQVHGVRGAAFPTTPFSSTVLNANTADPYTVAGIVTGQDSEFVVVIAHIRGNAGNTVTVTSTDPTPYTERVYAESSFGGNITSTFHDGIRITKGPTDNVTLDFDIAPAPDDGHIFVASFMEPASTFINAPSVPTLFPQPYFLYRSRPAKTSSDVPVPGQTFDSVTIYISILTHQVPTLLMYQMLEQFM